jgi:transcriptional regulator with XRE-family HTH domain
MNTGNSIIYTNFVLLIMTRYKQDAYEQALAFRRRGFSYAEIAKICNVSKGTVSNWLRHESFSQEIAKTNKLRATLENTKRLASINKARTTERKVQYVEMMRLAEIEYKNYRTSPLFVAGITICLTMGDTESDSVIRLTSSQTDLNRAFIRFLTNYLGVRKQDIRFWILLYPDLDEVVCMKHWCKKIGLSPAQFYKNQVIKGRGQHKTLHFGVLNTIIGSTLLKKKLLTWVTLLKKELS